MNPRKIKDITLFPKISNDPPKVLRLSDETDGEGHHVELTGIAWLKTMKREFPKQFEEYIQLTGIMTKEDAEKL